MSDDQHTCGKGLAASAVLPQSMADVLNGMSALFRNHIRALNAAAKSDQPEIDAYDRLSRNYAATAGQLTSLADLMASYRTLPMATHDVSILMDKASVSVFADLVAKQQALLDVLQQRVTEHSQMLSSMRGE